MSDEQVTEQTIEFLQDEIQSLEREVKQLKKALKKAHIKRFDMRDKIAMKLYPTLLNNLTGKLAAEDAYRLADHFLKVKEGIDITNVFK